MTEPLPPDPERPTATPEDARAAALDRLVAERRFARMRTLRAVKARHPDPPVNAALIDDLLAESAAAAAGGELAHAQQLAHVAALIARAAKLTGRLPSGGGRLTPALVQFDPGQTDFSPPAPLAERTTIQVTATGAKASFSRLLLHAMRGDLVIIERFGRPVARLVGEPLGDDPPFDPS